MSMTPHPIRRIAAAIVVVASTACATSPAATHQAAVVGPAKASADSARYPYTDADVHFMSAMIGHHAQAIVMAQWAPTHGASPSVRTLAERIINAQQDEIATMQQWLSDRHKPVPEAKAGPMTMQMNGMTHEMLMPGMLTDEQMKQLDAARGPEFDQLFLTFMIQHHRGAVSMVKTLFESYGAAQDETVFKFASDVNVDQSTEIARMERMLTALTH
jgi:uncharacterized protein (DUF305 family)